MRGSLLRQRRSCHGSAKSDPAVVISGVGDGRLHWRPRNTESVCAAIIRPPHRMIQSRAWEGWLIPGQVPHAPSPAAPADGGAWATRLEHGCGMVDLRNFQVYLSSESEKQAMLHSAAQLKDLPYTCGGCGSKVRGRVIADGNPGNSNDLVTWCYCVCGQPTSFKMVNGVVDQYPRALEFTVRTDWPSELQDLFKESALAFTGTAYTASAMVSRKILMLIAAKEGSQDISNFGKCVDFITNSVLTYPKAKPAIDVIRQIGNEANHQVQFVNETDSRRSLKIVELVLTAVYSLPAA